MTTEAKSQPAQTYYGAILNDAYQKRIGIKNEKFIPHPGTMIVKADDPDTETKGGIIIPDRATEAKATGVIIAVRDDDEHYEIGDRVLFRKQNVAQTVPLEGVGDCIILQYCGGVDDDVLAKIVPAR